MNDLIFSSESTSNLWILLLTALIWRAWFFSKPVAGLGLCHWFNQAINHFFGEYFISQNAEFKSADRLAGQSGYQISAIAISGLIVALVMVTAVDITSKSKKLPKQYYYDENKNLKIGFLALVYGMICYFFLSGLLSFIPSITSILSGGLAMASAGMAWALVAVFKYRGPVQALMFASLMFLFPVFTLILNGFMGYGIGAIFGIAGVVMVTFKPRWIIILIAPSLLYLGLSLYPSYMTAREDIRSKVWGGADLSERFNATFGGIAENWQWFDPNDEKQMEILNGRLNQNVLVGHSYEYITAGQTNYAFGDTLIDGLLALIPRIIWVDKPLTAGSNGLVTRFTGIKFSQGTSVGIGNMMEFYINFGLIGVFIGYFLIGLAVYYLDSMAGQAIFSMNANLFLLTIVPGQSLMNAIGSFVEWGPSLVGAIVLVWGFIRFVKPPEAIQWKTS
jgi:hypothetical protein